MTGRGSRRFVATWAAVATLVGCSVSAGPASPLTAESSPAGMTAKGPDPATPGVVDASGPAPSGCIHVTVMSSRAPATIESLTAIATVVVIGTVAAYEPAEWNTPDHRRPTPGSRDVIDAVLMTPVALRDVQPIVGAIESSGSAFSGGELGCDAYQFPETRRPPAGERDVVFLVPSADSRGQPIDVLQVLEAWAVDDADLVATEVEGPIPLSRLIARIRAKG